MTRKNLTTFLLAVKNLGGKPWTTIALVLAIGILAFALFAGLVLSNSLNNGINSLRARLGADFAVVPPGQESNYQGVLLSGAPAKFYFDRETERQLSQIDGVLLCTSQFFLASLNAACCSEEVQIIGIDYDTDFTIKPWISQVYGSGKGQLIVGSEIFVADDEMLTFYGYDMKVAAHLAKTGSGMDYSAYVDMDTMHELARAARAKGAVAEDLDIANSVSAVLIKAAPGYDSEAILSGIVQKTPGVGVIKTQSIISGIAGNLNFVSGIIRIVGIILGILSMLILAVLFSVFTLGRKKEFAVLRILGAVRGKLAGIVMSEALIVSMCGAVFGIIAGALMVMPFGTYWSYKMGLPFLMPGIGKLFAIAAMVLAASAAAGSAAAAYSAGKISRAETYATMREGE